MNIKSKKYFIILLFLIILLISVAPGYAFSSSIISISAGASHCLALTNDGRVLSWGNNDHGQLGDGTNMSTSSPTQVDYLDNVIAIAAGSDHSLALKDDGTVWAWGDNYHGTIGDGTTKDRFTPVQVSGLRDVKAIAAGTMVSFAIKEDGTLWAWGFNKRGDLGDGTLDDRLTPVQVKELANVTGIGDKGTFAITGDGRVWAWGNNLIVGFDDNSLNIYGILGDNYGGIRPTPFQVGQLDHVKSITNGDMHTVILKDDGTVWTWGINSYGQLGNNAKIEDNAVSTTPVLATGLSNIKEISAGRYYTLALKNDGTVWKWGEEYYVIPNMPGVSSKPISIPMQVNGIDNVKEISSGDNFFIALKNDGSVWGWGYNEDGQIGSGKSFIPSPMKIIGSSYITSPTITPNNTIVPDATVEFSHISNSPAGNPSVVPQNGWFDLRLIGFGALFVIIIGAVYILFVRK